MFLEPKRTFTLEDMEKVVLGEKIKISEQIKELLNNSRRIYEEEAKRRKIYGYCTGLGALQKSEVTCDPEIEKITIREHAIGAGKYAPSSWVRAFLAVRLFQLAQGHPPIRPEVIEYISESLNKGLEPLVPLHGSVGASGDLSQSAFVFRCMFLGEGRAILHGKRTTCSEALKALGLKPPKLAIGESLVLINNTAWSSATLGLAILQAERLIWRSLDVAGSLMELIGFNPEHFSIELSKSKRHESQVEVSKFMSRFSPMIKPERLQDPYSFRCIPQIYGSALEAIRFSRTLVEREISSSSENPIIYESKVYHGCNFHTSYIALASENVAWALTFIMNSIYQRLHNLMSSHINNVSDFLASEKSTVGAMILEYLIAALDSEARSSATPRTIEWLPTSLSQEDANPMTPNSILRIFKLIDILGWGIAAEAVVGSLIAKRLGKEFKWAVEAETTELRDALVGARRKIIGNILRYQPETLWSDIP